MKPKTEKKELTDKQLAAKYDNNKPVDFDTALKKMAKAPSPTTKKKRP